MAIRLTQRAAQEVKTIIEQQKRSTDTTYLRLEVKGGGCSGFSYSLDLTDNKGEHDKESESHGIKLICDPKSYRYLNGVTLEFRDEITVRGFVFNNPNAKGTCCCGSSFFV